MPSSMKIVLMSYEKRHKLCYALEKQPSKVYKSHIKQKRNRTEKNEKTYKYAAWNIVILPEQFPFRWGYVIMCERNERFNGGLSQSYCFLSRYFFGYVLFAVGIFLYTEISNSLCYHNIVCDRCLNWLRIFLSFCYVLFCSILHLCECGVLSSAFYLLDMPMPTCYTVKNIINTLRAVSFSLQWIKFSAQYLPCTFAFRRFDSAFSCISLWNVSEQMIYEYRRAYFLVSSSVLLF